ncbi:MAG: glutathione S-transferase N-terminal domain-containing protein [Sphingomonadales bacterium]|nr:glutathione S-transferase N-terminal domain-containing protein [Sphingomonadales bacterium]
MSLTLHYFGTPNGHKVAIALEEMGLSCTLVMVDILRGGQADPAFLTISPNGRIPALTHDRPEGRVVVFESGAILQYLARLTGRFTSADEAVRAEIESWLFWQMAGLGPTLGHVNWFARAARKPGRDPSETGLALHRFRKESARLFGVLEQRLDGRAFLCGAYSIADMACWPWVDKYHAHAGELADYPAIAAWRARIAARPAVQRALRLGEGQLVHTPEDIAAAGLTPGAKPR